MDSILYGYDVNLPTWLYLSGLLIVAVYFRFSRIWSSRNLDLILLLLISPGLLLVTLETQQTVGFIWLISTTGLLVIRAAFDPWQRWRPRFDQNMNAAGMVFLGCAALLFLGVRAWTAEIPFESEQTVMRAEAINVRDAGLANEQPAEPTAGPAAPMLASVVTFLVEGPADRILAICSHLAVVIGLLIAGRKLFDTPSTGVAMATLYILMPCTAFDVGAINRVLPAALTLWAFVLHRHPVSAGAMLGLACGSDLFPLFLVPIWASYYGRRGMKPFFTGLAIAATLSIASLAFVSADVDAFIQQLVGSFYPYRIDLNSGQFDGIWGENTWSPYRIPVLVVYFLTVIVFTFLPRQKSTETLLAQSVILILATQFWYPDKGGVYVLWYLPLLILMMFRPRLPGRFGSATEDAIASRRSNSSHDDRLATPSNATLR